MHLVSASQNNGAAEPISTRLMNRESTDFASLLPYEDNATCEFLTTLTTKRQELGIVAPKSKSKKSKKSREESKELEDGELDLVRVAAFVDYAMQFSCLYDALKKHRNLGSDKDLPAIQFIRGIHQCSHIQFEMVAAVIDAAHCFLVFVNEQDGLYTAGNQYSTVEAELSRSSPFSPEIRKDLIQLASKVVGLLNFVADRVMPSWTQRHVTLRLPHFSTEHVRSVTRWIRAYVGFCSAMCLWSMNQGGTANDTDDAVTYDCANSAYTAHCILGQANFTIKLSPVIPVPIDVELEATEVKNSAIDLGVMIPAETRLKQPKANELTPWFESVAWLPLYFHAVLRLSLSEVGVARQLFYLVHVNGGLAGTEALWNIDVQRKRYTPLSLDKTSGLDVAGSLVMKSVQRIPDDELCKKGSPVPPRLEKPLLFVGQNSD